MFKRKLLEYFAAPILGVFFLFLSTQKIVAICDPPDCDSCNPGQICGYAGTCCLDPPSSPPGGTPPPRPRPEWCESYPPGYNNRLCIGEGGDRWCTCCPDFWTLVPGSIYQTGCTTDPARACSGTRIGSNFCGCFGEYGEEDYYCAWSVTCQQYVCAPSCATTAPTNVVVTPTSVSSSNITWTPGSGGGSQRIYVGSNRAQVESNCPSGTGAGTGCVLAVTGLAPTLNTYNTGGILSPGTVYYYRVTNYSSATCLSNSATITALSSCQLTPSSLTLVQGSQAVVTASVNSSSAISRVDFSSSTADISLSPASDTTYQYQTTATGVTPTNPSATITANVYVSGVSGIACTSSIAAIVIPPYPWWQVKDADVASKGNLTSPVAFGSFFDLPGDGGFPGVPSYTSSSNLTSTNVSSLGWIADSDNLDQKIYDYQFFANQIPADTVITTVPSESVDGSFFESGGTMSGGYYWYKYDGSGSGLDLTLNSAMNLGSRKVILFVDSANFNINAPINLTDGQGFFLVITGVGAGGTKGNIIVDPAVGGGAGPNLEGIYEADNQFRTGDGNLQLQIRGSVTAYGGIDMKRNLGDALNGTSPSEVFEFAPDQIMLFPSAAIGSRKISWKEVAP